MKIKIDSLENLEEFAKKFVSCLEGNEVLLLYGNLAAGKTTFTKFLVKALEPSLVDEVNSPTFNIMNVYETSKFPIYHIDLYRVKEFDITDILNTGLIIVEWADYIDDRDLADTPVIRIKFDIVDENKRIITINSTESKITECLKSFGF